MEEVVRTDILNVLNNSLDFINKNDLVSLKDMSNHVIHNASIFQDKDSVNIAVIIYSISKILDRRKELDTRIKKIMVRAKETLTKNDINNYEKNVKELYRIISKLDKMFGLYVGRVIEMAEIKKSSKIYDHGISLAQSAEVLGISQWELMDYIGKTTIPDTFESDHIKKRIEFVRKIFGVK